MLINYKNKRKHDNVKYYNDCFSILDHASTTFQLKIKEAIHIQ